MMERGPIFIGGADRSGKSLMRLLLAGHPRIAISRRTNCWTGFYNRFGDLERPENFERCLAAMLRDKHVALLQPDGDRVRREFWQGPQTYARLFGLLHEQYAEQLGKARWGDQTELVERYADQIFEAYPDACVVHMLRDPRDRYVASKARHALSKGRAGGSAARWLYSAGLAERNLRRYPERYRVVRFETLVERPEATLRELCAFVGEEFVPAMLAMEQAPRYRSDTVAQAPCPLSPAFIGEYRAKLSGAELALLQGLVSRAMRRHGYAPDPVRLRLADHARIALLGPIDLALLFGWRGLEWARHQRPAPRSGRRSAAARAGRAARLQE